jgi:hypothetical protein
MMPPASSIYGNYDKGTHYIYNCTFIGIDFGTEVSRGGVYNNGGEQTTEFQMANCTFVNCIGIYFLCSSIPISFLL